MGEGSLKTKTFANLIWRFMERILAQLITTVVTIVLARILMPEDYGAIAIITVFINLCNIFVSKGFSTALVQKIDVDELDYSTVFYLNFAVTIFLYLALFFAAPAIASFYNVPILTPLLRVMGLRLPCTAINSVQHAYVSRRFQFKKYFFATLSGTVLSAAIGIYMALAGLGAWALCGQYLSSTIINTVVLCCTVKWRPKFIFSFKRAKILFSYGWKLLASSLLEELNIELKSFAIGKVYSTSDLAYYNRGKQFPTLLNTNVNEPVNSVLFPAMVEGQNDYVKMRHFLARALKTATFVMLPLQVGLAIVAEPLTRILLTEKWMASVPYMQIMCLCFCLTPLLTSNSQVLKALGKSGKYLLCSVLSNVVGIILMLIALPFGVLYIAIGGIVSTLFSVIMVAVMNGKIIGYGFFRQLFDLIPNILLVLFMTAITVGTGIALSYWSLIATLPFFDCIKLIVQIVVGIASYVLGAICFRNESFDYTKGLIASFFKRKKAKSERQKEQEVPVSDSEKEGENQSNEEPKDVISD